MHSKNLVKLEDRQWNFFCCCSCLGNCIFSALHFCFSHMKLKRKTKNLLRLPHFIRCSHNETLILFERRFAIWFCQGWVMIILWNFSYGMFYLFRPLKFLQHFKLRKRNKSLQSKTIWHWFRFLYYSFVIPFNHL